MRWTRPFRSIQVATVVKLQYTDFVSSIKFFMNNLQTVMGKS